MTRLVEPPGLDRPAVRSGDLRLDHRTLRTRTDALAEELASTPAGTVVGLRIGNHPAFLAAYLACVQAERTVVLLDALWTEAELTHAAGEIRPSLLVQCDADPGPATVFGVPVRVLAPDGELVGPGPTPSAPTETEPAAVVYWSSGSTGRPKPIRVSRTALEFRLADLGGFLGLGPDDRTLCILPLSHCHGIECVSLPTLRAGGEVVLHDPMTAEPGRVATLIAEQRVSVFSALPRFYGDLLGRDDTPADALATLRVPMCGSAALDPAVATRFHERFGVHIGQGYGLTEIGVVCLNRPDPEKDGRPPRYDAVGPVLPGVEWRIDAPDTQGIGELWVRGPGCESPARDADGWLRTQDLVRADDDGTLFVLGRRSSFLNLNGAKADPREIERTVETLPWVAECAVTGAVDGRGSERAVAHVVRRPGEGPADARAEAEVQRTVAEALTVFKVPGRVLFRDALPRTTLGKVLYPELPVPAFEPVPSDGVQPRNDAEQTVAAAWCAVLGVDEVDVEASFTRLGGTSVHLVELLALLGERLGRDDLTVVDLFRHPTVAAQAAAWGSGGTPDPREPSAAVREALERVSRRRGGAPPTP